MAEEDLVVLVIREGEGGDGGEVVDGRAMGEEDWAALVAESEALDVIRIRVERRRLVEQSRYFAGVARFSGSSRASWDVDWHVSVFCTLLACMHGFHTFLSSSVIAPLVHAAVYFGADVALTRCTNWVESELCDMSWGTEEDGLLADLSSIWCEGERSIRDLCVTSLAINFTQAMARTRFVALPLPLLEATIDHPKLTIKSEMELCSALLHWYENQKHGSPREAALHLFKKIQLDLLPFEFITRRLLRKYPLNAFCASPAISVGSDLVFSKSLMEVWGVLASQPVKEYLDFKPVIRLTEYLKELDFSFCHLITCHHLIAAAARVAPTPMSAPRKALLTSEQAAWPDFLELTNLERLNLSHCWRVEHKSLQLWLKLVCPNLLEFQAQHCGHPLQMVLDIGFSLPNLTVLDLSEEEEVTDIMGAVTRTKVICYSFRSQATRDPGKQYVSHRLRELSLRGRSEMTDDFLLRIARNCPSLEAVDLSGCSELSDAGLAAFMNAYDHFNFRKFSAAGTKFGLVSCKALVSQVGSSDELHQVLEVLDLAKCSGLGSEDLRSLLRALPFLLSLDLAFTKLDDMALSEFSGTSLRHLNLRETKVSGGALSFILARNSNMKDLNIRGCAQLAVHPLDFSLVPETFEWEHVEAGWGSSDSTFFFSSWKLQSLAVGVGGSISGDTLLRISKNCPRLKRLSLCFQVISDEDLSRAIRELKSLHTLELQHMSQSSGNLLKEIACSLLDLKTLKLERVMPSLSDNDLRLFSRSSTNLQSFSLLGCQRLTKASLHAMADAWRGIRDLRLEDCQHMLTEDGLRLLLISFQILEVLHLRHIGKVLPENFIEEATGNLPFLQKLAIDVCDAVGDKFSLPERKETSRLKSIYMSRCKSIRDAFHNFRAFTETSSWYRGRIHKDTVVLEWTSVRLKESVINERLTFE